MLSYQYIPAKKEERRSINIPEAQNGWLPDTYYKASKAFEPNPYRLDEVFYPQAEQTMS
jgi:hypothetical protein